MKLSKKAWVLFGLAMLFYAFDWAKIASALAVVGVLFELGMYVSIFFDQRGQEATNIERKNGESNSDSA